MRRLNKILRLLGYELNHKPKTFKLPQEYIEFEELFYACKPYTMTSPERMYALYKSIEYIIKNNIEGDFVECGVWKGGSAMLIAMTLKKFNVTNRKIYLFDTFEGMTPPTEKDVDPQGTKAHVLLSKSSKKKSIWCLAGLDEVRSNMESTGYPPSNIVYIQGKVEDTLSGFSIQKIALLRLDTDWYESTFAELNYLYPMLQQGGVLILDDYGHWKGAKEAVDEYLKKNQLSLLLNRIDYSGRLLIKR